MPTYALQCIYSQLEWALPNEEIRENLLKLIFGAAGWL
jgi:hypothetical protein